MVERLSTPLVRTSIMVERVSIPIGRTNKTVERLSIPTRYLQKQCFVKQLSIPIGQTHRFRLSVSIFYCPNTTALEMPVDTYLFGQYVQVTRYNRLLAKE